MVPEGWLAASLGDLVRLQRGHDLPSQERLSGDIEVIGGGGPNGFHNVARAPAPGIVIGRSGSGIGNAWWSDKPFWPLNTGLYVTDFLGNDEKFCFYWLDWLDFTPHNTGGAQPSLNRNFIYPIPIPLPPLSEQKKIAEILSTWDKAIETTEKLLANAEKQKRAVMEQLLTGKRRLKGFEGEWKRGRLGDCANVVSGPAFQSNRFVEDGLRLLRGSNVKRGTVDWSPSITQYWPDDVGYEKYHLRANDIAVAMDGYVGRSHAFFPTDPEPQVLLVQRVARIRAFQADPCFLYSHICSNAFVAHCERRKTSTAIAHITMNDIRDFPIRWPSLKEQNAIGIRIADAAEVLEAYRRQLELQQKEKRALMQQLLDPPPLNGSTLSYGFGHEGGPRWQTSDTSRKRSSRSFVRLKFCAARVCRWRMQSARSACRS